MRKSTVALEPAAAASIRFTAMTLTSSLVAGSVAAGVFLWAAGAVVLTAIRPRLAAHVKAAKVGVRMAITYGVVAAITPPIVRACLRWRFSYLLLTPSRYSGGRSGQEPGRHRDARAPAGHSCCHRHRRGAGRRRDGQPQPALACLRHLWRRRERAPVRRAALGAQLRHDLGRDDLRTSRALLRKRWSTGAASAHGPVSHVAYPNLPASPIAHTGSVPRVTSSVQIACRVRVSAPPWCRLLQRPPVWRRAAARAAALLRATPPAAP